MSKEMRVPTVGESISEVTVGQWFKKDGDLVQRQRSLSMAGCSDGRRRGRRALRARL